MKGTIQNREVFLSNLANRLGRPVKKEGVIRPHYRHQPQWDVLKNKSNDDLVDVLIEQCQNIQTDAYYVSKNDLSNTIERIIHKYGGGPIVVWEDKRLDEAKIRSFFQEELPKKKIDTHIWEANLQEENVQIAEKANVGITFSDITLAESGTVVLFSSEEKGRSVSLLPTTYIAIIPKSTIVPRMTQAAKQIHEKVESGEWIPSCINFISGPSNSADIEMNLVVGVHGPIHASYIIVEDL
ncbi:lactate utilization protein C [Bacillus sp. FJAT-47783]|uniref:LutC/YkgG family protein n=1 Tax=Bacillus sp. FJAT-47783 TaxID=2922712 RepID=UPI001FAE1E67|nr:lactate utilization protein C [Bacillus sp. FJAT-47783]